MEAFSSPADDWHKRFARYYADVLRSYAQSSARSLIALDRLLARQLACDLGRFDITPDMCIERDVIVFDVRSDQGELWVESDEVELGDEVSAEEGELPETVPVGDRIQDVRAARKIHRTQSQDPYNRETTIGAPLLKLQRGGQRVTGPLLYWDVDISYDPSSKRITVVKKTDVPDLNTMLLEPFLAEGQDMGEVIAAVRPVLLDVEDSAPLIKKVFEVVSGLFDDLEHLTVNAAVDTPVRDWLRAGNSEIAGRAILVNTPKSNAVLLEDLRRIAALHGASSSGPLTLLTRPEDSERDPLPPELPLSFSDSAGGVEPLLFPFASNPAQRRIALMAERATVLTVQGPPGTGKSHTIANLVCHLVATGQSVLVTSHQSKAVEVVTELLKPMRGLALSLASGDRQSSRDLQNRIQALLEDHSLRSESAQHAVTQGMEALAKLDRELRLLAHRFQELRRKEHEEWAGFRSLAELREWNRISPDDGPPSSVADLIKEHLPQWFDLRREVAARHGDLASLLSPDGKATPGTIEARIHSNLSRLVAVARSFEESPVGAEVHSVKDFCESSASDRSGARRLVARLLTWLEGDGRMLLDEADRAGVNSEGLSLAAWCRAARAASPDVTLRMQEAADELLVRFGDRNRVGGGSPRIVGEADALRLRDALLILGGARRSVLRWYLYPGVRRARRTAGVFLGYTAERSAFERWNQLIEQACERYDAERDASGLARELETYLPDGTSRRRMEPGDGHPADWLSSLRLVRAQCTLLRLAANAPVQYWQELASIVSGSERHSRDAVVAGIRVLRAVAALLDREGLLHAISDETPLSDEWRTAIAPILMDLERGRISNEVATILGDLEELLEHADHYIRLRNLERGELSAIPATLRGLEAEITAECSTPDWISDHVLDALQAHRLQQLIQGSLSTDPDDIASVAENLRTGQERRREIISRLVEYRLRLRQARTLEEGSAAAELRRVRRLLGMRKRLGASLVSLRDAIDYRAVVGACPAWLGTIDDVCRLFPPQAELFDYVIVDEASQCAQPALLPLALRCRHLIVVGDAKQLRPSFGRFLRRNDLDALRAKHGLSAHRAGVFAEGDDSLLDFADYRANQSGFLDEHFRCDPFIIAWSNERYYNNRLKILTHRRANSFQPPLILRELADADDDLDTKQNVEEAKAVVREIRRLTDNPSYARLTIGVVSPFRAQADLTQALIEREFEHDAELIRRHRILASTADGFQGDERDIVLYSFRLGPSSTPNSLGVLERDEERFNVAFTRARRLALSFISTPPSRFPAKDGKRGIARSWLDHTLRVQSGTRDGAVRRPDVFESEFERSVCERLRERGLQVVTQEPCGPFRIDLVVEDDEGRVLAVECDGAWKEDEFGQLRPEDYQRQDLIERGGWVVHRISGRKYLLDPVAEIDRTLEVLGLQSTDSEKAILRGESEVPGTPPADEEAKGQPEDTSDDAATIGVADSSDDAVEMVETTLPKEQPRVKQVVLGRPLDEARPLLRELIRWTLLGSRVHGSMFDRLIEINERLEGGIVLDEADIAALEFVHKIAVQHGFRSEQ